MMAPLIIRDKDAMRAFSREQRRAGKTIGFVPTMVRWVWGAHVCSASEAPWGARGRLTLAWPSLTLATLRCPTLPPSLLTAQGYLHEGHISLVRAAW